MLIDLLKIIFGCLILAWSADKLISGACSLAKHLGVAPLIIGLTVIALGTTLPEIVVSILASVGNNSGLAVGNVVGSNIANIGMVIGICAIIQPLQVKQSTIRLELLILAVISFGICALIWFVGLSVISGIAMLSCSIGFITWLVFRGLTSKNGNDKEFTQEFSEIDYTFVWSIFWVVLGLCLLLGSAKLLVQGAVGIATALGVSDVVIGLTIVALGTSLPELAASIAATRKGEDGLAVGNIIGSNIFNLTAVLCAPALINPHTAIDKRVLFQDLPVMLLLTTLFILMAYRRKGIGVIGRKFGIVFVVLYLGYILSLSVSQLV